MKKNYSGYAAISKTDIQNKAMTVLKTGQKAFILFCTLLVWAVNAKAQITETGHEVVRGELNFRVKAEYLRLHPEPLVIKWKDTAPKGRVPLHLDPIDPSLLRSRMLGLTPMAPPPSTPVPMMPVSPAPDTSFQSTLDNGTTIPPDTHGAIDATYCVTAVNSAVRIQTRAGISVSNVSLDAFWSSVLPGGGSFDPRVHYDSYSDRWIMVAVSGARAATSSILLAVSKTNNPTGEWWQYKITAYAAGDYWIDFPNVGINNKWITVSGVLFQNVGTGYNGCKTFVFNKANVLSGAGAPFTAITQSGSGNICPAITYSSTMGTMFMVEAWNGGAKAMRMWKITGSVGSEVMTSVGFPIADAPWWYQPFPVSGTSFGDNAPQLGSANLVNNGDNRVTQLIYMNNKLWFSHTIFLPYNAGANPTRSAVQWWQTDTTGLPLQVGRVDDSASGKFFAYPTIAVNNNEDALIGYSVFSSAMHPSAGYSLRLNSDPTDSFRTPTIYRNGQNTYYKTYGGSKNRWGDYSATMVDPVNNTDFWTIQEVSASTVNVWDTWWARVEPTAPCSTPTITGTLAACVGAGTTLSSPTSGGTWTSSNTSVATVVAGTGVVNGVSAGTATMTYSVSGGCAGTSVYTVNALPATITGTATVCVGATTTLSSTTGGGTWSSSNTSIATVVSGSGLVSGVAAGTSTISYTSGGCVRTTVVTVNALPATITGTATVCVGANTTLLSATAGGAWTSGNTSVATVVSGSGLVSGVAAGTATISYTVSGCVRTTIVTVNPLPNAGTISGAANVNVGSTTTLSNAITGGSWSSSNTAIATVGTTGVVTGVAAGTATISYTVSNSCGSAVAMYTITVNLISACIPTSGLVGWYPFDGNSNDLSGNGNNLSNIGGVSFATDRFGNSGASANFSAPEQMLSINTPSFPTGNANRTISVWYNQTTTNPSQTLFNMWNGSTGGTCHTSFSLLVDPTQYYIWSKCSDKGWATTNVINTWHNVILIYRNDSIFNYSDGVLINSESLASYYTYATPLNTTNAHFVVGSPNIDPGATFLRSFNGRIDDIAFYNRAISLSEITQLYNSGNIAGAITGSSSVCIGASTSLMNTVTGGSWTSSNTAVATVGSTGIVNGVAVGTAIISYTVSNECETTSATKTITVNPLPNAGTITGDSVVCEGSTITLSNSSVGGSWTSSNSDVATISDMGVVMGVLGGTAIISYTVTNTCGSVTSTKTIAISTYTNTVPTNSLVVWYPFDGNTNDYSGNGLNATNYGASLTTDRFGVPNSAYQFNGTSNYMRIANNALLNLTDSFTISSWINTTNVNAGQRIIDKCTVGSANSWLVDISPTGSALKRVRSILGGAAQTSSTPLITDNNTWYHVVVTYDMNKVRFYINNNLKDSFIVTTNTPVNALDVFIGAATNLSSNFFSGKLDDISIYNRSFSSSEIAGLYNSVGVAGAITGASTVCPGASISLSNVAVGGSWSSSNSSVATIGSTGIVTGIVAGTATISYSVSNACGSDVATKVITVTPLPVAGSIFGSSSVNVGSTISLSNTAAGGSWSSSNTAVATVGSTGEVTGLSAGTTTISYSVSNSCGTAIATKVVTVNFVFESGISGTLTVCVGSTTTLSNATSGGSWSSSNTAVAAINAEGVATGMIAGTSIISYTISGVSTTAVLTVNPLPIAGAISGAATVCAGSTITLTNPLVSGGTWSSSSDAASVSSTGVVTGVAAGSATISYSVSNSCGTAVATKEMAILSLPDAGTLSGTASICIGATTAFSSTVSGGTWSSGYPAGATVTSTGVVTGIVNGSFVISYRMVNGCGTAIATRTVTVSPVPNAGTIGGANEVCIGATTTMPFITAIGSVWSSSDPSVATINDSRVVTGIAVGTVTISHTSTTGCGTATATKVMSVNPLPDAGTLSGAAVVCVGNTITITPSVTGGTWISSNGTRATVSSAGEVIGASAGAVVISYRVTNSCGIATATHAVTVSPSATVAAIGGASAVCVGSTIALTNATAGGTWSSTNTSAATISSTGVVTGVAEGTTTISYEVNNSCGTASATKSITINPIPVAGTISGASAMCTGTTITLSTTGTGGSWISGNPAAATINSSGEVTAIAAGTVPMTYRVTNSCGSANAIHPVTITTSPFVGAIAGASFVCVGSTISLTNPTAGGTWSSSSDNATISSTGVVTGVAAGTTTISYIIASGCGSITATRVVTVSPLPNAGTISGTASICIGATTAFSSTVSGGTWSSGYPAGATVSATGVVTGIVNGSFVISYRMINGCGTAIATRIVTVSPVPNAGTIGGANTVCVGATTTMPHITAVGGVWSSSDPSVATINASRVVTGIAAGTVTISHTVTNGCGTATATKVMTVNPIPVAGTLSGAAIICVGSTATFTTSVSGGTWSSNNPSKASVNSSGLVTGVSAGTAIISYRVTNSCGIATVTRAVTVSPAVAVAAIGGTSSVCAGSTITLTNATAGGTWSSTNTSAATIGSTGVVTGVADGTTTISYEVSNSCGTIAATKSITVNPLPVAGTISGASAMCAGTTITLSTTGTGGSWISGNPSAATINSSGEVAAISAGTVIITYRVTNSCGTANAVHIVTISPLPVLGAIAGASLVCLGSSTTYTNPTDAGGGIWSSSETTVATINAGTGVFTAVAVGTTTISYVKTNGCGSITATRVVTVLPLPDAGTLSGTASICVGATTTFSSTISGGTWSSGYPAGAIVSSTGVVTGLVNGSFVINYRMSNACGTSLASRIVTVSPVPDAGTIGGANEVCVGATTTMPFISAMGGVWSSSDPTVATINASRVVTGIAVGTVTISHTVSNGCGTDIATKVMTVNPLPIAGTLSGASGVCVGNTITITPSASGGTWFSSNATRASVSSSGVVTGVSAGVAVINYRVTTSCGVATATHTVTVSPAVALAAIGGLTSVCEGSTITLTNATASGTWSSTNTSAATISSTGVVTGVAVGTTIISYVVSNSCETVSATQTITVNPLPVAGTISGASAMCTGTTTTLTTTGTGGIWISANPAAATINSSGEVTAIAAGTIPMTYSVTNICGTDIAIHPIVITSPPTVGAISGLSFVCEGTTISLTNPTAGGIWSSTNTSVATVSSTGVVTGVTAGTTIISYHVVNICGTATATNIITVNPLPVAGTISGASAMCTGTTTTLTTTGTGGIWISADPAAATINSSGEVTAIAAGTIPMTYSVTNSCGTDIAIHPIVITSPPTVGAISGLSFVCEGTTISLTNPTSGGIWSSTNTSVATVSSTGVVTGVTAGTTIISYHVINICGTATATQGVTVNPAVSVAAIGGSSSLCAGSTITLTNTTTGGTWSSTNTSVATIGSTGIVTGVAGGNTTISYVVSNSCGTIAATKSITVNPLPDAGIISGASNMCSGTNTTLSTTGTGGTWISSNPPLATVNSSTGVVTAIAAGIVTITYRATNSCGTANAIYTVTISALPAIGAISGASLVCAGSNSTYTNPVGGVGGVWSSSETTVATIVAGTGVLTGVAAGTTTISYVKTNGCTSSTATRVVTVLPLPVVGVTSGTSTICTGTTTTLSNTVSGGTWSSSYPAGATVSTAGVVTGVANGNFIISYRVVNGCGTAFEFFPITVMSSPILNPISGTATVCTLATTTFANSTAGGVWTSTNTGVATIANPAVGVITGVAAGTSAISYTVTNMCGSTAVGRVVTVTVCGTRPVVTDNTGEDKNSVFSVAPNPTTGVITLTTNVTGKVSLYTIDGKQLQQYEAKTGNTSIVLPAGIASGVYMLHFNGENGSSKIVRLVYQQ